MYMAQGQRQITQEKKMKKGFVTLITHCKFQPAVFDTFSENDFTLFSPYKSVGMQI